MKNIILIGMMGCGKTTVGQLLSQALGRELVDTDQRIECQEGRSIPDIFARNGERYFRDLELSLCRELARTQNLVIACGGGLPLRDECMAALKPGGVVFWLNRDPGGTYDTLDVSGRPLAQEGRGAFLERYAQRAPVYRRWADYVLEGPEIATAQAAACELKKILETVNADPS